MQETGEGSIPEETKEVKEIIEERKRAVINFFSESKKYKNYIIGILLLAIISLGYYIRTANIKYLYGFIPDVDSYAFLRYAEYILEHGKLMALDTLRYYPWGYNPTYEFGLLSYFLAYFTKVIQFFQSTATAIDGAIYYPPVMFVIALIFFFLLVKKLFDWRVALLSSALLAVIPSFIYRTLAGVADKEALAIALMFMGLYFYISGLKSHKNKNAVIWGICAGISTGIMGLVWGGITFVFLTIGSFMFIETFLNKLQRKDYYLYLAWLVPTIAIMMAGYPTRYTLLGFASSTTTSIAIFAFVYAGVHLLLNEYRGGAVRKAINEKILKKDIPPAITSLIATALVLVIAIIIIFGIKFIPEKIKDLIFNLTEPFGKTRWAVTVAESHQPYFVDWVAELNWRFILLFMAGAGFMFYETAKHAKKSAVYLSVVLFTIMIFLIGMSRYSPGSALNGESDIAHIAYFAPMLLFIAVIVYGYIKYYKKDRQIYEKIKGINSGYIFTLVFFVLMLLAARTAIRLHFVLSPAVAITGAYACIWLWDRAGRLADKYYRYGIYLAIAVLFAVIFIHYAQDSYNQAIGTGMPSYHIQWQNGMAWAKENTDESAVFAHWWDYGYWVQWGARRATLTDGGNAVQAINHFVGRHVLMANNETEALQYLKARGATHILIVNDDIGKYPAFSSIGSDRNYDRDSWIPLFGLDTAQTQETRNETIYVYTGGTALDDDFIFQEKLFPASRAGVAGFMVPFTNESIGQPTAVLVYNGAFAYVPLDCLVANKQEYDFSREEKDVLQGCLMIIPTIQNSQMNTIGAAYYISPEVRKTLFAQLYLFGKEWEHIKTAYTDEANMPFMVYNGHPVGPLKIWSIDYTGTEDMQIPDYYYGTTLPDPEVDRR